LRSGWIANTSRGRGLSRRRGLRGSRGATGCLHCQRDRNTEELAARRLHLFIADRREPKACVDGDRTKMARIRDTGRRSDVPNRGSRAGRKSLTDIVAGEQDSPVRAAAARYLALDPDSISEDALIQVAAADKNKTRELFLGLVNHGVLMAPRAMGALSTPMGEDDIQQFIDAVDDVVAERKASWAVL